MNRAARRLSLSWLGPRSSHLWLENGPQGLSHLPTPSPFPWRRNLCAWDCKVTPVYCTCQEGNTIGCIPSNDGLDARFGVVFPHDIKIHGVSRFGFAGLPVSKSRNADCPDRCGFTLQSDATKHGWRGMVAETCGDRGMDQDDRSGAGPGFAC